jgi:hypothetical protein
MRRRAGSSGCSPDVLGRGARDDVRGYVVQHLRDAGGVLVVDETGFVRKGPGRRARGGSSTRARPGGWRTASWASSAPRSPARAARSSTVSCTGRSPGRTSGTAAGRRTYRMACSSLPSPSSPG